MPVTGTAVKNVGKDGAPFQDEVGRGKSALLRGFRKRDVVYCGVTLQVSLQKRENIGNDLQFSLHDVDGINLGSRKFR